jgi:putative SOS response-associated peptidase YedK
MFSKMQLLADSKAVVSRFNAESILPDYSFLSQNEISGFGHALHPIIMQNKVETVCDYFHWGLVPSDWKKSPTDIWNHTISAKLEYINKRYAWQKVSQNRCLVAATAYFEYQWNDRKGNSKTKYIVKNIEVDLFALAGLFSIWHNAEGNILKTFAVCTTQANEIMQLVHNKDADKGYHRMPVMLNVDDEQAWLDKSNHYMDFGFPNYKPELIASPVNANLPIQTQLF